MNIERDRQPEIDIFPVVHMDCSYNRFEPSHKNRHRILVDNRTHVHSTIVDDMYRCLNKRWNFCNRDCIYADNSLIHSYLIENDFERNEKKNDYTYCSIEKTKLET